MNTDTKSEPASFLDQAVAYRHGLVKFIRHRMRTPKDVAEDTAQRIILRAIVMQKEGKTPNIPHAKAYLQSMARNMMTDNFRRAARKPECQMYQNIRAPNGEERIVIEALNQFAPSNPDAAIELQEVFARVRTLQEIYSVPFMMRYRRGMEIDEIGQELGIKPQTIKTRLFRVKKWLQTPPSVVSNISASALENHNI